MMSACSFCFGDSLFPVASLPFMIICDVICDCMMVFGGPVSVMPFSSRSGSLYVIVPMTVPQSMHTISP
jgi:hypothetical protein